MRRVAAIAAELDGAPGRARAGWAREHLGLDLEEHTWDATMKAALRERSEVRRTLAVDPAFVGLEAYLLRVRGDGQIEPDLITELAGLPGVVQLLEQDEDLDILAVCLVEDFKELSRLREAVRARAGNRGVTTHRLSRMTSRPEVATWKALAERFVLAARATGAHGQK